MPADPNFAQTAALIGDPTRAAMLGALLGGQALTASELAHGAGVTPQTASMHLTRLVEGQLLRVVASGRHRYFQLAGPQVAQALEALATIAPPARITSLRESERARAVRFARTCYDHLAGTVGVALTERLIERELIAKSDEIYQVTDIGWRWLEQQAIDVRRVGQGRRVAARACLDWSERRYHLAGAVGAAITDWLFAQGWIVRAESGRAVRLTETGRAGFAAEWGLRIDNR